GGRAPADGLPLRGTQPAAGRTGGAGGGVALVEPVAAVPRRHHAGPAAERRAGAAARQLGGMGQRSAKRGGVGGVAEVRDAGPALWGGALGRADGGAAGFGADAASARPSPQAGRGGRRRGAGVSSAGLGGQATCL